METSSLAYITAPFAGWIISQLLKIAINSRYQLNWEDSFRSGGMPSSHAAFMFALASAVAIGEGIDSVAFAITFAIASIVVYDATDVRRTTGQQTDAINKILQKDKVKATIKHDARGHTIPEVIGGVVVGVVVGAVTVVLM